jgi:hypothetical protein
MKDDWQAILVAVIVATCQDSRGRQGAKLPGSKEMEKMLDWVEEMNERNFRRRLQVWHRNRGG